MTQEVSRATINFLKTMTVIAILGAINWGLIGLFNWNLVDAFLGGGANEETSLASRIVYSFIGLSGLLAIFLLPSARGRDFHQQLRHPS